MKNELTFTLLSERDDFVDWLHEKFFLAKHQNLRGVVDQAAQHFNTERRPSAFGNTYNKKQPREPQLVILCYKDQNFTAILLPTREERQIMKELIPQDGLLFFNVFPIGGGRVNIEADYSGDAQVPFRHILAAIADAHEEAANKIGKYLKSVLPTNEPAQSEKSQEPVRKSVFVHQLEDIRNSVARMGDALLDLHFGEVLPELTPNEVNNSLLTQAEKSKEPVTQIQSTGKKKLTVLLSIEATEGHIRAAISPVHETNFYVIQQPYEGERHNVIYALPATGSATPSVPQPVVPETPIGVYIVLAGRNNSAIIVFLPLGDDTVGILSEFYELVKQYFQDLNLLSEQNNNQPEQTDMQQRPKELTFRQVNNSVRNSLRIIKGCEFQSKKEDGETLYDIFIVTESAKLSLGIFRVWEWHDGTGRTDWFSPDSSDPEIERLRKAILNLIVVDLMSAKKSIPIDKIVEAEKLEDHREQGKPGRPHSQDDLWAWGQVNIHNRPMNDVRSEWLKRDGVVARKLQDAERQFNRITKPKWGQKTK